MDDQQYWDTMAIHRALIRMSDNPRQSLHADPLSGQLMHQVNRAGRQERFGHSAVDYFRMPF